MNQRQETAARSCLEAAESNSMDFPRIVAALIEAEFESYAVDFRRGTATYYLPDGESVELRAQPARSPVAPAFDPARMQAAIREAQQQAPGYTYAGFREKAVSAGCAGYMVSFCGRRALYHGRTGETHVEHFPNQ